MRNLLIIDDDVTFCETLKRALDKKQCDVRIAHSVTEALSAAESFDPEHVLLDLKIHHESGLTLIPKLLAIDPHIRIVMLTGYASIATAVEAIKLGAMHYLAKPVGIEEIIAAFSRTEGNPDASIDSEPMTITELEREHIRTVLKRNQGNISATARELKMHRRSLQRKLDKMPA